MILDPKPLNIIWGDNEALIWQYTDGTWSWQMIGMGFNFKKLMQGYYIEHTDLEDNPIQLISFTNNVPVLWRRFDNEIKACTCGGTKTKTTHSYWCDGRLLNLDV